MEKVHPDIYFNYEALKAQIRQDKKPIKGTSMVIDGQLVTIDAADTTKEEVDETINKFKQPCTSRSGLKDIPGPWKCTHCNMIPTMSRALLMVHDPCFFKNTKQVNGDQLKCPISGCPQGVSYSSVAQLRVHVESSHFKDGDN